MVRTKSSKSVGTYKLIEPNIVYQLLTIINKDGTASHTYSAETPLFYQGQTPIVAYLLVRGKIILKRNKRIKEHLGPGTLLGLHELLHHTASPYEAQVMKDANVIFIDKTTIKNLFENSNSNLSDIIQNLIH